MYVSVFTVYTSAVPGIHIIKNIQTVSRRRLTLVCGHGIDIDTFDCFIYSLFVSSSVLMLFSA